MFKLNLHFWEIKLACLREPPICGEIVKQLWQDFYTDDKITLMRWKHPFKSQSYYEKHKEGGFIASIMVNKLSTCKDFHLQTLRKMEHLTIQHPAVNINVGNL